LHPLHKSPELPQGIIEKVFGFQQVDIKKRLEHINQSSMEVRLPLDYRINRSFSEIFIEEEIRILSC